MEKLCIKINKIFEVLTVISFVMAMIFALINVVIRYIPNIRFSGASDIAMLAFVWSVFVGSVTAFFQKRHLKVTLLASLLPKKWKPSILLLSKFLVIFVLGLISVGFYIQINLNQGVLNLGYYDYPISWKYFSGLTFSVVSLIFVLFDLISGGWRREL